MLMRNTETIPGKHSAEALGLARVSIVRARNAVRHIFAGLKNVLGGEISEYTKLQADSREQAIPRMIEYAIVNVHFSTSVSARGAAEILACGTAIKSA